MAPGRQKRFPAAAGKAKVPQAKAEIRDSRLRSLLTAMGSAKDPKSALERLMHGFLRPGSDGEETTLAIAEFLKVIFSTERDLVKEAFKAAMQVEAIWHDLFEDALVVTLNELEDALVRDYTDEDDWKHFVRLLATALEVWGRYPTQSEKLLDFGKNILGKWINSFKKPKLTTVDPTGSFNQLLYSACSHHLLKQSGLVILEVYPAAFDVLRDMIYQRVISDDLPRLAKINYLDTLLEMHARSQFARGVGREKRSERSADVLELPPKVIVHEDDDDGTLEVALPESVAATSLPSSTAMSVRDRPIIVAHLKSLDREDEPPFIVSSCEPLVVGRSRGRCHVLVNDPKVSRVHAEVRATKDVVTLVLLSPSNFVVINSQKIGDSQESKPNLPIVLSHGDVIEVGKDQFKLEYVVHSEIAPVKVKPLCRESNFSTGLHSSPSAKEVPLPKSLQATKEVESCMPKKRPKAQKAGDLIRESQARSRYKDPDSFPVSSLTGPKSTTSMGRQRKKSASRSTKRVPTPVTTSEDEEDDDVYVEEVKYV